MKLNEIKPNKKSIQNVKRLGRGMGSGKGKTCGKGHKGQKARAGYTKKLHFEGGQMPKQRRLPKTGFVSVKQKYTKSIRLSDLNRLEKNPIDIKYLKKCKILNNKFKFIKIISSGSLSKSINIKGINITKGAKLKVKENGGNIT
jgi:large subunit ribosomal protein L15